MFSIKNWIKHIIDICFRNVVFRINSGLAKDMKVRGALGAVRKSSLSLEERFLLTLDLRGKTVYDIGGNIGIVTLFFSREVGDSGKVITFEPNPVNCDRIRENLSLNAITNTQIIGMAVGSSAGTAELAFRSAETATGSLNNDIKTDIIGNRGSKVIHVPVDTLDSIIAREKIPLPDFIKIDVEGFEMNVLSGMSGTISRKKPDLFIEIHGLTREMKISNVGKVVKFLSDHGYDIKHIESATSITMINSEIACEGHLYAGTGKPAMKSAVRP